MFPHVVCQTSLRIDGYVLSRTARTCIGLELACPMEENIAKWHGSKLGKYEEEIPGTKNGWKFYAVVIEVGARGLDPTVRAQWPFPIGHTETFGKVLMQTAYTSCDQVKLHHLA